MTTGITLPREDVLPAWRAAVLAYRREYRVTPEDLLASTAAFDAFREVLPEMRLRGAGACGRDPGGAGHQEARRGVQHLEGPAEAVFLRIANAGRGGFSLPDWREGRRLGRGSKGRLWPPAACGRPVSIVQRRRFPLDSLLASMACRSGFPFRRLCEMLGHDGAALNHLL